MRNLALAFCLLTLSATSFAMTKDEAKAVYAADKQKVLTGDLSFDWQQFRLAADQGGTAYFDWHPLRDAFMKKMDANDTAAALAKADEIIGHNMAEPEGHLLAVVAYRAMGKKDEADFQRKVVGAWVASLEKTGDGKSAKTAMTVVTVDEEYFYLRVVVGAGMPLSQALVHQDGHSFDQMKVKTEDGTEREVWFNVDIPMAKEAAMFSGKG